MSFLPLSVQFVVPVAFGAVAIDNGLLPHLLLPHHAGKGKLTDLLYWTFPIVHIAGRSAYHPNTRYSTVRSLFD